MRKQKLQPLLGDNIDVMANIRWQAVPHTGVTVMTKVRLFILT